MTPEEEATLRAQLDGIAIDPAKLHAIIYVFDAPGGRITGSVAMRPNLSKTAALVAMELADRVMTAAFVHPFQGKPGSGKPQF